MYSLKVGLVAMAHNCRAKTLRLLCFQSCEHARHAGSLWANVERIFLVGFEIFDLRSICFVYGDSYGGLSPTF